MDDLQRHYLGIMGIQVWEQRTAVPAEEKAQGERPKEGGEQRNANLAPFTVDEEQAEKQLQGERGKGSVEPIAVEPALSALNLAPEKDISALDWDALHRQVAECTICNELVANRTQTVFGVGNPQAELMVIGEAPGADEDRQGEPFVGRAGKLLNAMLAAIGLPREQVYIANILKCRPPDNRDPKLEEAAACAAYLARQIALIQPKVILVVGRIAAQNLLHTDVPLGKLRGQEHRLESGVPVVVTYHPAYLLRSPREKRKAWLDLCFAMDILSQRQGQEG